MHPIHNLKVLSYDTFIKKKKKKGKNLLRSSPQFPCSKSILNFGGVM